MQRRKIKTMARDVFIFNPGPAALPEVVLDSTSKAVKDFAGTKMSIMEVSHRSKEFDSLINDTSVILRRLMGIPDNYKILYLQGGASLQFAMVPINLLGPGKVADYIDTGRWSANAIKEAQKIGKVNIAASTKEENYTRIPALSEIKLTPDACYCHITSNNTVHGTQWKSFPDTGSVPLVADMSSDILSRRINVSDFGIIYAGAQKNMGPAGVTVVIIRDDLAGMAPDNTPTMLNYATHAGKNSMFNTPPVIAVYVVHEVLKWIEDMGGIEKIEEINDKKASAIYDVIDSSDFYRGTVDKDSRSKMNITLRLPSEDLEKEFVSRATEAGFLGLKGHRSVGGIRVSLYNAVPLEAAERLAEFMTAFQMEH